MGKRKDITGQVFGKLTAIECAGKKPGKRYYQWRCMCECGNETVVDISALTSGNTKSCGCGKYDGLKKYNDSQSEKNKISNGAVFGKLTVIEDLGYLQHVEGHRRRWYKCLCECGKYKNVMGNSLKNGHTISCGECHMRSRGEYEIEQILLANNILYQNDVPFVELYKETGRKLRFDFIIYDSNNNPIRFIEFDGRQHTLGPDTELWSNSDPLETIQERDNIKNNFCLIHNYALVRIPYTKLGKITLQDIFGDEYLVKGDDEKRG